jgi:hypothetical protein
MKSITAIEYQSEKWKKELMQREAFKGPKIKNIHLYKHTKRIKQRALFGLIQTIN